MCCFGYGPVECAADTQCELGRGRCNLENNLCHSDHSVTCTRDEDCPRGDLSRFCDDGHCVRLNPAGEPLPVCRSIACTATPTFYCDHHAPEAPNTAEDDLCGTMDTVPDCPGDLTDPDDCARLCTGTGAPRCREIATCREAFAYPRISQLLEVTRNAACAPGATCAPTAPPDTQHTPAPLARQLLGHYVLRALEPVVGESLRQSVGGFTGLMQALGFQGKVEIHEAIEQARVRWVANSDGGLTLPGYYELDVRFVEPQIQVGFASIRFLETTPARLRIRLQPYFYPDGPPGGHCETQCRVRRPDLTMHFAVAEAALLEERANRVLGPYTIEGCGCGLPPETGPGDCTASWALRECVPDGTLSISDVDDLPVELRISLTAAIDRQLGNLDNMLYRVLSDPVVGGMVLGRLHAIEALYDARCDFASSTAPAATSIPASVECNRGRATVRGIGVADTIEALHISNGRANVVGRDNP